ncbi:MAG: spore coat associated protein CotJA [Ruminococcus sp.]|nr:spore coat associated protein CotJA [Ruminococcus sp.]
MPNYQNNMRYGRQGNMRQSCGSGYGMQRTMPQTEARCHAANPRSRADSMQRGEDTCCTPSPQSEQECCGARENTERRGREASRSCGCKKEDRLHGMALAMAYVPWQTWGDIYDLCEAFQAGTIFEDLNKPFLGRGGWKQ